MTANYFMPTRRARTLRGLLSGRGHRVLSTRFAARLLENIAAGVASFEYVSAARSFQFSLNVVTDEGYYNIYGPDVTERREAERALTQNKDTL
jgi:hypothetical protein